MRPVYDRILSITGNVITVRAAGIRYEELAEVTSARGKSLAQVIKIEDDDLVYLQVFAGSKGVSTEDEVRFLGDSMRVAFSENMLGRTFNGSGVPIDDGPPIDESLRVLDTNAQLKRLGTDLTSVFVEHRDRVSSTVARRDE